MISLIDTSDFAPYGRHHYNNHSGKPEIQISNRASHLTPVSGMQDMTLSDKEVWHLRNEDGVEEEIYIRDQTVIWSSGNGSGLLKSFTVEGVVKQSGWCNFLIAADGKPGEVEKKGIFILHDDSGGHQGMRHSVIEVYTRTGQDYVAALPFLASKVHPMRHGLVIERVEAADETKGEMPVLFSLMHPLDEVAPIVSKGSRTTNSKVKFMSSSKQIVNILTGPSLALTYDQTSGLHSVWLVRKAILEEAIFQNEQSSMETPQRKSYNSSSSHSKLTISAQSPSLSPYNRFLSSRIESPRDSRLSCSPGFSHSFSHSHSPSISMGASGMLRYQSPPHLIVSTPPMSPLIQGTMNETNMSEGEPVFPDICLEHLWSEKTSRELIRGRAFEAFVTRDFCGQQYLCYLLNTSDHLRALKFEQSNDQKQLIFGSLTSIPAKGCIHLKHLDMMVVLEPGSELALYSGMSKISRLHVHGVRSRLGLPQTPRTKPMMTSSRPVSALDVLDESVNLPSPVPSQLNESSRLVDSIDEYQFIPTEGTCIHSVRDPGLGKFTVLTSDGNIWRTSLPNLAHSPMIRQCLHALKQVLPKDLSLLVVSKWYCAQNQPGYENQSEWTKFAKFLYNAMGFDTSRLTITEQELDLSTSPVLPNKRARGSDEGSNDDWTYLINSEHHRYTSLSLGPVLGLEPVDPRTNSRRHSADAKVDDTAILFQHFPCIFFALHVLYEEVRLQILYREELKSLCLLLFHMARNLRLDEYVTRYCSQSAELSNLLDESVQIRDSQLAKLQRPGYMTEQPPDIFKWLYDCLRNQPLDAFPYLPSVNETTKLVINMYAMVLSKPDQPLSSAHYLRLISVAGRRKSMDQSTLTVEHEFTNSYEKLALYMFEHNVGPDKLDQLHFGVALPLREALYRCRSSPPSSWPEKAYALIGRQDLAAQTTFTKFKTEPRNDDKDGMECLDTKMLSLRFSEDLRIDEVRRLLQSSRPVKIVLTQRPEVSDHEFIEEQENQLYSFCIRTIALPVGRGMFTLRTTQPSSGETLPIPELCLTGKAPPRNNTIDLSHTDTPPNMTVWPKFHNGVAAGLRIADSSKIDSTWIMYNKLQSAELTNEHAGFLFALGLNNHLSMLDSLNVHDYLMKGHELTSVGLLIGISAAKRATMDVATTRLLSIHLDALLPPTSTDLDIKHNLKVAAIFGVGLVYQGTAHRHMAEVLLSEIGRPPGPEMENCTDRESYSLSAGLALGMVMLGRGDEVTGLSDLNISDHLFNYMVGGHKRPPLGPNRDRFKSGSYQVKEGNVVNVDVTSPGATLALGMMFFRTGNKAVSEWLTAPDTQFLLDFIRPDFLVLRTISRSLVLWDDIHPSKEWIDANIPEIVQRYALRNDVDENVDIDYETMSQAYVNIIAGGCFALGLRFAGSANRAAYHTLLNYARRFVKYLNMPSVMELAKKNVIENCAVVALLSLSMVMAGTGDLEVMRICRHLRSRVGSSHNFVMYGSYMAISQSIGLLFLGGGRFSLSTSPESVAAMLCAFYPMYPNHSNDNRYHLQALRHLYVLASEPRLMLPKDVDTSLPCPSEVQIYFKDTPYYQNRFYCTWAPCILPELSLLQKVLIVGKRFQSVTFDEKNMNVLKQILNSGMGLVPVKKRPGLKEDPITHDWNTLASDPTTQEFIAVFCDPNHRVMTEIIRTCIAQEKPEVLATYIALDQLLRSVQKTARMVDLWQLKLILTYWCVSQQDGSLMNGDFMLYAKNKIMTCLELWASNSFDSISRYFETGVVRDQRCALFLVWFDLLSNQKFNFAECRKSQNLGTLFRQFHSLGLPSTTKIMLMNILRSSENVSRMS